MWNFIQQIMWRYRRPDMTVFLGDSAFNGPHEFWDPLINLRINDSEDIAIRQRGFTPRPIDTGLGLMNLDCYTVDVRRMPMRDGAAMTPESLLDHVRRNLNDFVDHRWGDFEPYDDNDASRWQSESPLGALLIVNCRFSRIVDRAPIAFVQHTQSDWVFATLKGPSLGGPGTHPVSGNRQFGFRRRSDGRIVFFTRAADRITGWWRLGTSPLTFYGGHCIWSSYQKLLCEFVIHNGGEATIPKPYMFPYHNWNDPKRLFPVENDGG